MRYIVTTLMISVFLPTLAMAEWEKIDSLGYPFGTTTDTYSSGDLDYTDLFANDIAKAILNPVKLRVKDSAAIKEFIENPKLRHYFIRELQNAEDLPDHVANAYITAVSVINEETGENFLTLFSPDPAKALEILSHQRSLLLEEAKVESFMNPTKESEAYLTSDEQTRILQYIRDNFKVTASEVPSYGDGMGISEGD